MSHQKFYAAKIMAYDDTFYLVEVNEHNRHVGSMAEALGISEAGRAAAFCHDLGKIGNLEKAIAGRKPQTAQDYLGAYVDWIVKRAGLDKNLKDTMERKRFAQALLRRGTWQERYEVLKALLDGQVPDDRLQELVGLPISPFPRHAEGILEMAQRISVRNDVRQAKCPPELIDYAFELIRLHHSFRVDRIVEAASALEARLPGASAQQFVRDLHTLISADNVVSGLYEKALAVTGGAFSFGDPVQESFLLHDLEGDGKVEWLLSSDNLRRCRVHVEWQIAGKSQRLVLNLEYHVVKVG